MTDYQMDQNGTLQKCLTNQKKNGMGFSSIQIHALDLDKKELLDMLRLVRGFERKIKALLDRIA
jgi:hypothetical protein